MTEKSVITIGLLWHSVNSDNLGIGALTVSHIAMIDKVAHELGIAVRYKVLGWRDPRSAYIQRPDLDVTALQGRDLVRPGGLFAAIRQCDVVLDISTGDGFTDLYGPRRFVLGAFSRTVVLLARRPWILSPQTIGPFEREWTKFAAGLLMRRARKVVSRDDLTTEFLGEFGLGSKLVESTDVAFRLPCTQRHPAREQRCTLALTSQVCYSTAATAATICLRSPPTILPLCAGC